MTDDLRFGHAERVDAFADAVDGHVEALGVVITHWFLRDRHTALEVETEGDLVTGGQIRQQSDEDDGDDAGQ